VSPLLEKNAPWALLEAQRKKMAPPAVPRKFGLLSHQYSLIFVIPSQKEFGALIL
jgi:hypothetical protein